MADAIISVVVEQIAEIIRVKISKEVNLVKDLDQKVNSLLEQLETVRDVLEDAERKRFVDKSVRGWLVRLEDASYEMEDVLDEWQTALRKFQIQQQQQQQQQQHSNAAPKNKVCSFVSCVCFQKVVVRRDISKKIENMKVKLDLILVEKDRYGLVTNSPSTTIERVQSTSSVDLEEVKGREIDKDVVASKIFTMMPPGQVKPEERQLEIVSIVGVGGVGKTTLAQLVFNDSRQKDCFKLAKWICVSGPLDVTKIAEKIVESVMGNSLSFNQLEVLLQQLNKCISGKKFLLVLDDVWTADHTQWEPLKSTLKSCCGIGSKILVTTRKENVAKMLDTHENGIHRLGVLSDESCWLLLKHIALFDKDEEKYDKYKDIGMKIVYKCRGLPLAAKTLGSQLRCKNNLEEWENVLNSEIWELEEVQGEIFPHLLLSYNELSPALKRCFSYCAIFPKDSNIEVDRVIEHWMALGYLGSDIGIDCGGDMELRGQQYFKNLAMCSLFQDFMKDDSGEHIYSFKLHDIVHDFAQFLRKNGTMTNKMTSCQACSPQLVSQVKEYRSLFKDSEDLHICGCLSSIRVLGLREYSRIPNGIEKFIHLRWLDLSMYSDLSVSCEFLETIFNELYNLQTLFLINCNLDEIPRGIGNLIRLRHLDLSNNDIEELPREIGNLINLRHLNLSYNKYLDELPMEIGNLTNLRHLNLSWNKSLKELSENMCHMHELETLNINNCLMLSEVPQGVERLVNLKHLHCFDTPYLMNLRLNNLISKNPYLHKLSNEFVA